MNFQKYVSTANAFINEVAQELGIPKEQARVGRIVRSVLHALRARLTPEQSLHLLAQLPMLIKAVYVDGWRLSRSPDLTIRSEADFFSEMMRDDRLASADFPQSDDPKRAALAVFAVLSRHVAQGEIRDVEREMPRALRRLMEEARA